MKLVLKQIAPEIDVTGFGDRAPRYVAGVVNAASPFALHTDSGEVLPCQITTSMRSEAGNMVELTVVFRVDGDDLRVEGHG